MPKLSPLKLTFFFVLTAFSVVVFCSVVDAKVFIAFSDLDLTKDVKILVYKVTDKGHKFIGEFNSTDSIKLRDNESYIFVFKPSEQVWFQNPLNAIELFTLTTPSILAFFLFFIVIVSSAWLITRLFR
jgi:hypothetical protein